MENNIVQRALGRIEGTQTQILAELKNLRENFGDHKNEDQKNFSSVRRLVADQQEAIRKAFDAQAVARNQHLNEQDVKLDALKQDSDRAKGAGYVIIAIIGALATFVGGAVIAVLSGWIKFH